MKKSILILFILLGLASCRKEDPSVVLQNNIIGSWNISAARLSPTDDWTYISPVSNYPTCISGDHLGSPWNHNYTIQDENTIKVTGANLGGDIYWDIEFAGGFDSMIIYFGDGSEMQLCR